MYCIPCNITISGSLIDKKIVRKHNNLNLNWKFHHQADMYQRIGITEQTMETKVKPENKSQKAKRLQLISKFGSFVSITCIGKLRTASWFIHLCSPSTQVSSVLAVHERYLITGAQDNCRIGIHPQTNRHKSSYTENLKNFKAASCSELTRILLLTLWHLAAFGDFWKKKHRNARGFAWEFLWSGKCYGPGQSVKRCCRSVPPNKKFAPPTKKIFFECRLEDWPTVWALEQLSSAIGGGAMVLVRQPKTTGFRLKSRYDIFVGRFSKC